MTAGSTYSRTNGTSLLPAAWEHVRGLPGIPPGDVLSPAEWFDYNSASAAERAEFNRQAADALSVRPEFLSRADRASESPTTAQSSCREETLDAYETAQLAEISMAAAATALGICESDLERELTKFSGVVALRILGPGTCIYRSVSLLAATACHGSVASRFVGNYWYLSPPGSYLSQAEWYALAASLVWHPLHGYAGFTLRSAIAVLYGMAWPWPVLLPNGELLQVAGMMQCYIPGLTSEFLAPSMEGAGRFEPFEDAINGSCP